MNRKRHGSVSEKAPNARQEYLDESLVYQKTIGRRTTPRRSLRVHFVPVPARVVIMIAVTEFALDAGLFYVRLMLWINYCVLGYPGPEPYVKAGA